MGANDALHPPFRLTERERRYGASARGDPARTAPHHTPVHLLLTLSEISRRANLSLSTAHRLVGELRAWGALDRSEDGRYSIGMRVLELGAPEPQGLRLRNVALPFLSDLHSALATDVTLSVRDGCDAVYVESLRSRHGAPVLTRLGGRWPLHATGTGQVLLANAPAEVQEAVLGGKLKRFTPKTVADPETLRRTLAEVRSRGYSVVDESITAGAIAIAVPVRGPGDRVVSALGMTIRRGSCPPESVLPALSTTARAISRGLGSPSAKARVQV
ncbi:IclR family transcriptional regulator [Microbacterium amylolyticum]|uniref:DNA-binding IclR family transcriptional regulator n=1 Tax=Microbacterium amylolyticum TaxID=936337 RepID=A0ABS4ZI23_9MICO|nr:IclR family transcriptional regulator [Microbacterium amylolyticum]MBP2436929.1 DNA-binding IclR family transcriptional regulator [Microbacterium amylolyticum]